MGPGTDPVWSFDHRIGGSATKPGVSCPFADGPGRAPRPARTRSSAGCPAPRPCSWPNGRERCGATPATSRWWPTPPSSRWSPTSSSSPAGPASVRPRPAGRVRGGPGRRAGGVRGKYVTAAGVSAGIDMALALAARIAGDEIAKAIQLGIQYDPRLPFDAGSPAPDRRCVRRVGQADPARPRPDPGDDQRRSECGAPSPPTRCFHGANRGRNRPVRS